MAELVYDCPHCGASKIAFTCHGSDYHGQRFCNTLFVCRNCHDAIVAKFVVSGRSDPQKSHGDPRTNGHTLLDVYPSPTLLEAPPHVPPNLSDEYVEGLNVLRGRNFKSAGMMFRRVLEIATKGLAPEKKDVRLYDRIVHLGEGGKITPELRGLADRIRLDGNEANHEEEFDETKVAQLKEFTYLFLLYTFTLPKLVELAQDKAPDESKAPA